jgi:hypothetical protein
VTSNQRTAGDIRGRQLAALLASQPASIETVRLEERAAALEAKPARQGVPGK